MALITTILSSYDLQKKMTDAGRNYYSLEAYKELINFYDESGDVEFDAVAICCDWTEDTEANIKNDYRNLDRIYEASTTEELLEALNYYTYAVLLNNGMILYINF